MILYFGFAAYDDGHVDETFMYRSKRRVKREMKAIEKIDNKFNLKARYYLCKVNTKKRREAWKQI